MPPDPPGPDPAPALARLDPASPRFATEAVDLLLDASRRAGASDLHLQPGPEGLAARCRIDGVLQPLAVLPGELAPNVVARLKVLADLLTYRTDVPQEGRIRSSPGRPETRVSTFPTLHGERAVVRLFADPGRLLDLDDLGLGPGLLDPLRVALAEASGLIVLCGPAGSGKTTTLYASLHALASSSGGHRCIATLEDPIEAAVPGVVQSQVNPSAGFSLESGLRSLLRQDPEVIAVGEIRDPATAEVAFQAALTGHLVLTTFHAGSAAGAVGRLSDMGIEPYLLRSGVRAILSQRLVRLLCDSCARPIRSADDPALLGLPVGRCRAPVGCDRCRGAGYLGRTPVAELLVPGRGPVARAVLSRADVDRIESAAVASGMVPLWDHARSFASSGLTSPAEIRRVFGLVHHPAPEGPASDPRVEAITEGGDANSRPR
ncbi:GspE/PulE family protein [Tautonia plasticadhaerens]|uniref:Type II secretion system protein E n=1 Tax=Tautonia plasticadhaerens TaxID=2527974 RepID=A0A518GWT4_9BACT|nr:GspE/PulE family protein [Tautonia plasticadhaerens]QDV33043.1 Type II secretion system protein E [Tautonia plasticadhaerens]